MRGTESALFDIMSVGLYKRDYAKIETTVAKTAEILHDRLTPTSDQAFEKIKKVNIAAGRKYAKKLGLHPNDYLNEFVRSVLNEKIIFEIKRRKLKHYEISNSIKGSRSKITQLMNRKTKRISVDFMLRVLSILGVSIRISFNDEGSRFGTRSKVPDLEP